MNTVQFTYFVFLMVVDVLLYSIIAQAKPLTSCLQTSVTCRTAQATLTILARLTHREENMYHCVYMVVMS